MKKTFVSVLLILSMLLTTFTAYAPAATANNENTSLKSIYDIGVTLTNEQISKIWSKLPTAEEMIASGDYSIYDNTPREQITDTLYLPDESATLPVINESADAPIRTMRNYTLYEPRVGRTIPLIYMQIKDTNQWVQVPINLLLETNQTAIPDDIERMPHSISSEPLTSSTQSSTRVLSGAWAIGVYANPAQVAGSATVYGAGRVLKQMSWQFSFKEPKVYDQTNNSMMHDF